MCLISMICMGAIGNDEEMAFKNGTDLLDWPRILT